MLTLRQICLAKNYRIAGQQPKPFPGRWPTRWLIVFRDKNKKIIWDYKGKPSLMIMRRALKAMRSEGVLIVYEFDARCMIQVALDACPVNRLIASEVNNALYRVYYPFTQRNLDFFSAWMHSKLKPLQIVGKRGSRVVYSKIVPDLAKAADYKAVVEYRNWLKKSNIGWGRGRQVKGVPSVNLSDLKPPDLGRAFACTHCNNLMPPIPRLHVGQQVACPNCGWINLNYW